MFNFMDGTWRAMPICRADPDGGSGNLAVCSRELGTLKSGRVSKYFDFY